MKNNKISTLKKWLFVLTFLSSVFIITLLLSNNFDTKLSDNNRKDYEEFLLSQSKFMSFDYGDDTIQKEKPQAPNEAALHEFFATIDPSKKYVPRERLGKAYRQLKNMPQANRELTWTEHNSDMGGRTRCVVFDPNDTENKKIWAGSATGGLWFNNDITDSNTEWTPVNDLLPNLSISSIVFDVNNSQTIYVGTGEAETSVITYRASTGRGIGIYKSTNGGSSFELLPSTEEFAYVSDVFVRNESGTSIIYAGVVSGIYEGQTHLSNPSEGLYRSSDNGLSWTQVLPNIESDSRIYSPADIESSADGSRLFVGTMRNTDMNGGGIILYSDNGIDWTIYNDYKTEIENEPEYNIPGRVKLARAESDANTVYAVFEAALENSTTGFIYSLGRFIIRTDNKGEDWSEVQQPVLQPGEPIGRWATLAWHALTLAIDPNDKETIFIGGLDLWKTSNGGTSWAQISSWWTWNEPPGSFYPPYVHADQHCIRYRPGMSDEIIFATDGGVFYSSSANLAQPEFEERNHHYNTLQYYTCAISPIAQADYFLAGAQDNGTIRYNGNPVSTDNIFSYGDGAYCFIDEDQPELQITSHYYGNLYFSNNNGQSVISTFEATGGTFVNPAAYDYKLNLIYMNAVSFSGDYANKITRTKNFPNNTSEDILTLSTASSVPFSCITYSEYSPENTSTIFLGTQSGRVFKVTNAESSPNTMEVGSVEFPLGNISSIALGASEDEILVTFSNYGVSSIWFTTDGGTTWAEKETNLPDMPIRWALFNPQNYNNIMLATELGIWTTENITSDDATWSPSSANIPNVRIDMLRLRKVDNAVLAATHGRGLFTTNFFSSGIDAGIFAVEHPPESFNLVSSSEELTVNIANFGSQTIATGQVGYKINENEPIKEDFAHSLSAGGNYLHSFLTPLDFSNSGFHNLKTWTEVTEDVNFSNDTLSLTYIIGSLGIEEVVVNNLNISPNPATGGYVNIKYNATPNTKVTLRIFDTNGKIVYVSETNSPKDYSKTINVSSLKKSATYILRIDNAGRNVSKKFIVL